MKVGDLSKLDRCETFQRGTTQLVYDHELRYIQCKYNICWCGIPKIPTNYDLRVTSSRTQNVCVGYLNTHILG